MTAGVVTGPAVARPAVLLRPMRAQLLVLRRPAVLGSLLGLLPALAVVATSMSFATADAVAVPPDPGERPALLLSALALPAGMTAGFAATSSLLGLLVLVLFLATTAGEHSRGTLRVLLTREPRRLRLVGGQVLAVLLVTWAALVLALLASVATAFVAAGLRDVPTEAWTSADALRAAGADYLRAAGAAAGYGLLGAALGTLVRSVPVALGVGVAWFGPFEHLLQEAWSGANRWFPGLLLESVTAGGTTSSGLARSAVVGAALVATVVGLAAIDLRRRDVLS